MRLALAVAATILNLAALLPLALFALYAAFNVDAATEPLWVAWPSCAIVATALTILGLWRLRPGRPRRLVLGGAAGLHAAVLAYGLWEMIRHTPPAAAELLIVGAPLIVAPIISIAAIVLAPSRVER